MDGWTEELMKGWRKRGWKGEKNEWKKEGRKD